MIAGDLTVPENCKKAVDQTLEQFGRLDALVNNAGVNDRVGLERGNPADYVASLQRNLLHYYNMAHYALAALKESRGSIVNIASKTAITGQGDTSGYASAKGAVLSFSRSLAVELAPRVRVNAVSPGLIDTPMVVPLLKARGPQLIEQTPLKRLGSPDEVARVVAFLCSDWASFVTGETVHINGGLYIAS